MSNWTDILSKDTPVDESHADCAICDLSHFGLLCIRGADVRDFLQGQLTNDINQVSPQLAQLSSYCSPKGRMLGSFWVFQRDDALFMQLPMALLPAIHKRLQMFVMRSDVTIDDVSGEFARFGLIGDCADSLLPFAPQDDKATLTRDAISVIRMPGTPTRFEVIGPVDQLADLWTTAREKAQHLGADCWGLADIRAGVPTVFEQTVEAFVPQMANLQLIDGVSFTKGCYTGQEVVARMQYLGKLKRRMYRARIDGSERPTPGADVFSPNSESGQGAGRIVAAAPSPDGGFEALAVLQISSAEAGDLRLADAAGPALTLLDLPYSFAPPEG